jgi:Thioredoxin
MRPATRWLFAILGAVACACAPAIAGPGRQEVNYAALYAQGVTFAEFLDQARARREEWRAHYNDATVSPDLITRMRALPERRRILVVAADYCLDSTNTIPYIARLVDGAPERLELRVLDTTRGRPVMEAHRTPDGRAATPTVVILGEDGRFLAAWTERPSGTQTWFLEQQKVMMQKPLHDQLEAWYARDAGKTTVAEIAVLLSR